MNLLTSATPSLHLSISFVHENSTFCELLAMCTSHANKSILQMWSVTKLSQSSVDHKNESKILFEINKSDHKLPKTTCTYSHLNGRFEHFFIYSWMSFLLWEKTNAVINAGVMWRPTTITLANVGRNKIQNVWRQLRVFCVWRFPHIRYIIIQCDTENNRRNSLTWLWR